MILKRHTSIFYFIIVLCCFALPSCTQMRSIVALGGSTDHFLHLHSDICILYEPGAEKFAQKVASLLPEAIHKIVDKHYIPFKHTPQVYVCASKQSCFELTGHKAPAVVTNKLFLSPVLVQEARPLHLYLAHELSHLHLKQRIGRTGLLKLPTWFSEGLAEVASGGASASYISKQNVLAAIKEGNVFTPDEGRNLLFSFLFPKGASYWELDRNMYYHQCMLFVSYLRSINAEAFKNLLLSVLNRNSFASAWAESFNHDLRFYWASFLRDIKTDNHSFK